MKIIFCFFLALGNSMCFGACLADAIRGESIAFNAGLGLLSGSIVVASIFVAVKAIEQEGRE